MKALIVAIALAAGMTSPVAGAAWGYSGFQLDLQAPKARPGGGQERGQPGRDARPDRQSDREDRRERLSDDERRALHRDLDKANRELYKPRPR